MDKDDLEIEKLLNRIRKIQYTNPKKREHFEEILLLINSYKGYNETLTLQKAKAYRDLGKLESNSNYVYAALNILKEIPSTYVVDVNLVKTYCVLAMLEYNAEYAIAAKELMQKNIELYKEKGLVKRIKYAINYIKDEKNISKNYPKVKELYSKIYYDATNIAEIKDANILEWDKDVLVLAYYEKHNKKAGLNYLLNLKKKYSDDEEKIKELNRLKTPFEQKNNSIFEISKYGKIINASIDYDAKYEKPEEKEQKINNIERVIKKNDINIPVKKEIIKSKMCSSYGNNINRYNNINSNNSKNDSKPNSNQNVLLIRDAYHSEVMDIASYIYSRTYDIDNKESWTRKLDHFLALVEYPIDNKEKFNEFIHILIAFNNQKLLRNQLDTNKLKKKIYNI